MYHNFSEDISMYVKGKLPLDIWRLLNFKLGILLDNEWIINST